MKILLMLALAFPLASAARTGAKPVAKAKGVISKLGSSCVGACKNGVVKSLERGEKVLTTVVSGVGKIALPKVAREKLSKIFAKVPTMFKRNKSEEVAAVVQANVKEMTSKEPWDGVAKKNLDKVTEEVGQGKSLDKAVQVAFNVQGKEAENKANEIKEACK